MRYTIQQTDLDTFDLYDTETHEYLVQDESYAACVAIKNCLVAKEERFTGLRKEMKDETKTKPPEHCLEA